MKNLKLSHKLIVAFLSLGILPALLVTWIALHKSNAALEAKAYELLGSARENKKAQVHYYFESIRKQISTLSDDTMIIDATKGFRTAYDNYLRESNIQPSDLATMRTSVRNYYTHEYLPEYQSQNAGSSITVDRLLNGIDDTGIALQYAYISNNSYPLGSKDGLTRAEGTATYHDLHEKYHPSIRHFLDEFGYYDIFILDPESGNIIYSVFKELDYGTSLQTGPYANTNFAEAFQVASRATEKNMTHLIDFEQYTPSYEAPASFMSSPIYDGDTLVGVLIFQMPIDRINQITGALTANSSDANTDNRAGLGETGEVYMVGSDNLLRSNSYFDQDKYSVVASFRNQQQGKIETEATEAALRNQSGEQIAPNYKGNDVLTSYTPVDLGDGVTWALVAEIDSAEAHALIPQIRNAVLITLAVIAGLIIGFGLWLANSITAPLRRVFKGLKTFSNQEFNQMGDTFKKIGSDISLATQSISSMSGHISEASTNQAASLEETSASMEEISSVTQQNSEHAQQSSQLSAAAQSSVETGNHAMAEMSQVMGKIKASSEEIAGILKIIDDISFQTNILALNAAVEAARAGESGAGFAVVADEVRQLAQRTANASKDTAKLIQESVGNAKNGVQAGEHLTEILKKIETNVAQAAELAEGVSSASVEQSDGITQINGALTQLDSSTQRNAAESEELAAQSVQLTQVVKSLDALIGIQTPAAPQPATPSNALPHAPAPSGQLDGGWQSNHSDTADNHSDFTFTDTPNNRDFQDLHSN